MMLQLDRERIKGSTSSQNEVVGGGWTTFDET